MIRHVILHLNILADPVRLREHYTVGLAKLMQERYGNSQTFWIDIQQQIIADWASYHADLNYSGDNGMADMREGHFRVTRALFRLGEIPEPPKEEITRLAQDLIAQAPLAGDALLQDAHNILEWLHKKNILTSIVSYYPESQLKAILSGANVEEKIAFGIGADTFEHYEMDERYFEFLLNKLDAQPENCLYVDKQEMALASAKKIAIHILLLEANPGALQQIKNFFP